MIPSYGSEGPGADACVEPLQVAVSGGQSGPDPVTRPTTGHRDSRTPQALRGSPESAPNLPPPALRCATWPRTMFRDHCCAGFGSEID